MLANHSCCSGVINKLRRLTFLLTYPHDLKRRLPVVKRQAGGNIQHFFHSHSSPYSLHPQNHF
jgi:hypothetical protein